MQQMSQLKAAGYDLDSINQHFRCSAHILNFSVQDILKIMNVEKNNENDNDACEVRNDTGDLNDDSRKTDQAPFDDFEKSNDNEPSEISFDSETPEREDGRLLVIAYRPLF